MSPALNNTRAVAARVVRQLSHDRRFLGLSLAAPLVIIYVMKIFFDGMPLPSEGPPVSVQRLKPMIESLNLPPDQKELLSNLEAQMNPSRPLRAEPSQFVVPLGAFIVHLLTYLLCAIVLVRERTAQTLARMFVNGYLQAEIIGGYLLAYTGLATLQSLLVLGELTLLFKLGYSVGTLLSIYFVIWLLAVTSVALGILVSNFARTEAQIFPFIPSVALPSILLSGVIIPVEKLPAWAQSLSYATPLYYANQVIQHLIKPGGALSDDWASLCGLPLYGAVILFLAARTLKEFD